MKLVPQRLLIGCVLLIALLAGLAWVYAQGRIAAQPVDPTVLSGADIGFRIHGRKGDAVVGEIVVRIDGEWKRAQFSYAVKPVTTGN
jgi:hypothetical protein